MTSDTARSAATRLASLPIPRWTNSIKEARFMLGTVPLAASDTHRANGEINAVYRGRRFGLS